MAANPVVVPITPPRVAFLTPDGFIAREWYRFLLSLATQASTGIEITDFLQYAPDATATNAALEAELADVRQTLNALPPIAQDPLLRDTRQTLDQLPISATVSQIAVLQSAVDALAFSPALGSYNSAPAMMVGSTPVSGGTSGYILYNNAGVLGNLATTGTGNVVLATSPTLVTPALGTPASGVVTNLTGTASININGTVGATTPTTGAFTTVNTLTVGLGGSSVASNTAVGVSALTANTSGQLNAAFGYQAMKVNTSGICCVGVGYTALNANTTGSGNVMVGGWQSNGVYNPPFDPTTQNDRVMIGSAATSNAYVAVAWTVTSDARDKTDFAPVPHGLDFIAQLKPTAYRYKFNRNDTEGHGPLRYGFLAQDILALEGNAPVIIDNEDPDRLKLTDQNLIAVLVNAVQELQALVIDLNARVIG